MCGGGCELMYCGHHFEVCVNIVSSCTPETNIMLSQLYLSKKKKKPKKIVLKIRIM